MRLWVDILPLPLGREKASVAVMHCEGVNEWLSRACVSNGGRLTGLGKRVYACMCPQVCKKNAKPSWSSFDVGVQSLCNAVFSQPIRFKVFSWDKSKNLMVLRCRVRVAGASDSQC